MVSERDRDKLVALVHGELGQVEAQRLVTRIHSDEELRLEYEALLAASDSLEDLFVQPAVEDLSAGQMRKILGGGGPSRYRRMFIVSGGAAIAASLAIVLWTQNQSQKVEMVVAEQKQAVAAPSAPPPAEGLMEQIGAPLETAAAPTAMAVASDQLAGAASEALAKDASAPAKMKGYGGARMALKDAAVAGSLAPATKKMQVVASEVKFVNIKNQQKALTYLQKQLDGKPSCIDDNLMRITIVVGREGRILIATKAPNAKTVSCLQTLLGDHAEAIQTRAPKAGRIVFTLKQLD